VQQHPHARTMVGTFCFRHGRPQFCLFLTLAPPP
jgi:hypothetical protein